MLGAYVNVADLENYLKLPQGSEDQDILQFCITAAERGIDKAAQRPDGCFAPSILDEDAEPEERTFLTSGRSGMRNGMAILHVPEFYGSIVSINVTTTLSGEYQLLDEALYEPFPLDVDLDVRPGTGIASDDIDWRDYRRVRIATGWGFPETPADIRLGALMQAARYWDRKGYINGTGGAGEWGQQTMPKLDEDVRAIAESYRPVLVG